jgi:hypothetical protein
MTMASVSANEPCPINDMNQYLVNSRPSTWPHVFAGAILMIFTLLHLAYLKTEGGLDAQNPVFPFLNDRTMVLLAAAAEGTTALICFRFRGRSLTNLIILSFVATICWYRWAFHFTGGTDCHCLGILGRLLHLSSATERAVPIAALVLIGLTTVPWLLRLSPKVLRSSLAITCLAYLLAASPPAEAQSLELGGKYETSNCNVSNGQPIQVTAQHFSFAVVLSSNAWSIAVTNLNDSSQWEQLVFDSTNTYALTSYTNHFGAISTNTLFAAITPSGVYKPAVNSFVHVYVPWLAFGLSPDTIERTPKGSLPLPWLVARLNPGAFGYEWIATASADRRLTKDLQIVRSTSLDLPDEKQELLRHDMDYPLTLADRRYYIDQLRTRRFTRNGFVAAKYSCTNWLETNNVSVPMLAQFKCYTYHPKRTLEPFFQATLQTTRVIVHDHALAVLPTPMEPVQVHDYRYKTSNATRIYAFADYALRAGAPWKPDDDPFLLSQAANWLQRGPRYDAFSMRKNLVAWLVLMAVMMPPLIALLIRKKNQTKKPSSNI